ncbi:acetyltransferase [Chryseobacterium lactis]|uniref:Acetyltransferase n=1 Tax=Chryseobacterium lactis TaxID=1241981 RepID=A0A3G6RNJ9_CHRLC|nr:DapH/DapD/GlmU-related protein [Chryseobacterium lactis]AZA80401.1 acetyltransferase [Chryseobacterium lactis]AZB05403.1 acetyltransferase [Chryseobacterium lactis]PNW11552.1 acetyltransferase [Chryseobacterium lactis]
MKTKEEILIFPYSGTGIEALDCLSADQCCIGFISDDISIIGTKQYGITIYGRDAFQEFPDAKVIAVNGSPVSFQRRKQIIDGLEIEINRFTTVIHPKAIIGNNVKVGTNVLMMAGVVATANAEIGSHICILPNTVIHHDSKIGDYTLVAANNTICGDVTIGENCYLGASSTIRNGVSIGDQVLLGSGSNVVKNLISGIIVKGNPAK